MRNAGQNAEKMQAFKRRGWVKFDVDRLVVAWLAKAESPALAAALDADLRALWLRSGGTWFVGVNALPNDARGNIDDSGPLSGQAVSFIADNLGLGRFDWDAAQVSVIYPGYPVKSPLESAPAFTYRTTKDAAHVDGLHPVGPNRRRHLQECHGFLLALPLTKTGAGASPLVVWEGAHHIMRAAFRSALQNHDPKDWPRLDLTDVYHAARHQVFAACKRTKLHASPGECILVHRHMLHGVAPWRRGASAPPDGRVVLYFRPEIDRKIWLDAP